MVDTGQIQTYLSGVHSRYERWRRDSALTETIAAQRTTFTFKQFVQTEVQFPEEQPKIKTLPLVESIRKYLKSENVLLAGLPGVGKSSALWYCLDLLAKEELEVHQPRIPVLLSLKRCGQFTTPEDRSGLLGLIQDELDPEIELDIKEIKTLIFKEKRFILLLDGLNEIPANVTSTELKAFREKCERCGVPLICSTRELGGGNLGIQRKLEIQPLSPTETDLFLQDCLPEHQEQIRQLLRRDNRELSRTPFVLWMLYHLLKETGTLAETLGEAFRQFFRFHFRKYKEDAPVPQESRQDWNLWLEELAFSMLNSSDPLDPGLVISREEAENILAEKFGTLYSDSSRIRELEKYHFLTPVSDREITFQHQLIQEYYAAERLLEKLHEEPQLLQKWIEQKYIPLQMYYLNYLKWTEAVEILLGLLDDKEEALEIISLALETDIFLGATLSKYIHLSLQPKALKEITELDLLPNLKVQLLGLTQSPSIITTLKNILAEQEREDMHLTAIHALGKINNEDALCILEESLDHPNNSVRMVSVLMSRYIDSKSSIKILLKALRNDNEVVRDLAATQLSTTRHRQQVRVSLQRMLEQKNQPYINSVTTAIKRFGEQDQDSTSEYFTPIIMLDFSFLRVDTPEAIASDDELPLIDALQSDNSSIRLKALYQVPSSKTPNLLPYLRKMLSQDSHKSLTGNVTHAMRAIQSYCGFYNYNIYRQACNQATQKSDMRISQMSNETNNVLNNATFNAPVNFGNNPTGDFIDTQNNFNADPEVQNTVSDLQTLLAQFQTQYPSTNTESEALSIIDAEFTEIKQSQNHKLATLRKQLLNPERHFQAGKATLVEVLKHFLEESVWAKATITYFDKLSEEPDYGV